MRHRKQSGRLGRTSAHREALVRNLVTALLEHERVETTDAKARQLKRVADRMITLGKKGDLHARRRALRVIRSREVAAKVFDDLAERFRERPGGYTRVLKRRARVGDAAPMSVVELVEGAPPRTAPKQKGRGRKREPAAEAKSTPGKRLARKKQPAKAAAKDEPAKPRRRGRRAKPAE